MRFGAFVWLQITVPPSRPALDPEAALRSEILSSPDLEFVIKALRLDADLRTVADWQARHELLRKNITVHVTAQDAGIDLIEITVISEDASSAQKIANAIADSHSLACLHEGWGSS